MHLTSQPRPAAIRRKQFGRLFAILATAFAAASFHAEAQAPLDVRIALVIGNSAYRAVPELTNPRNDANAIAATFKQHLLKHLAELLAMPSDERLKKRYEKFRAHGHFLEKTEDSSEMKAAKNAEPVAA